MFLRIYTRFTTHPLLFATAQKAAALGTSLLSPFSKWVRLPAFTGWGYSKDLPRFAGRTFRDRYKYRPLPTEPRKSVGFPPQNEEALRRDPAQDDTNRIEQFTSELTSLGGHVTLTEEPTQEIIKFLQTRGFKKILLEANILDESLLQKAGIEFTNTPDPQIPVGVTRAVCGLADTGSILETDAALLASLLPEVHLAVLSQSNLLSSLPEAMDLVKDKNAVFITGPSRTADIEMTLTIGVHGPKEIHVFVDDSKSG